MVNKGKKLDEILDAAQNYVVKVLSAAVNGPRHGVAPIGGTSGANLLLRLLTVWTGFVFPILIFLATRILQIRDHDAAVSTIVLDPFFLWALFVTFFTVSFIASFMIVQSVDSKSKYLKQFMAGVKWGFVAIIALLIAPLVSFVVQ